MRFASLFIASLSLAAVACTDSGSATPEQHQLDSALQTYESHAPEAYSFIYNRSCGECDPASVQPIRIYVTNDTITSASYVETGAAVPTQIAANLRTLRGLFDTVQGLIDQGAASVVVTYDTELGYPKQASFDPIAEAVDDEWGFTVSQLTLGAANN
ncbi:MAG TPA: DUF6174 domain-containing protein [Kofleriaceae bacterium]